MKYLFMITPCNDVTGRTLSSTSLFADIILYFGIDNFFTFIFLYFPLHLHLQCNNVVSIITMYSMPVLNGISFMKCEHSAF